MRRAMARRAALAALMAAAPAAPVAAGEADFSGSVGAELRWFIDDPGFPGQLEHTQVSLLFEPEIRYHSDQGRHQFRVVPFLRLDGEDDERTHYDLREAYWRWVGEEAEVLVGVNQVFWGVTESRHLVDVINQVDGVEDIDEEDRLGQPMVSVAVQRDWGRLEAFAMPRFRERTFPGTEGRLRTPVPVDTDAARYESGAEEWHVDGALRYSHFIGDWDVGASLFHGTGREPRLLPGADGARLIPYYDQILQVGVDVQYTREAWLWKLESIVREGQGRTFGALVGGFEHTFYQLGGGAADLGVLVEYLWDDRDASAPPTAFDDDLFAGLRLALNDVQDTQVLMGAIVDRSRRSTLVLVEAERRLGQHLTLEFEGRWLLNVDDEDLLASTQDDSFAALRLSWHF